MSSYSGSTVYKCPYCHAEKWIICQSSGNTFGATYWSDLTMEAPMLSQLPPIQCCPGCHRYYDICEVQSRWDELLPGEILFSVRHENENYDTDISEYLSLKQACAAVAQFQAEGKPRQLTKARLLVIKTYNDRFRGSSMNIIRDAKGRIVESWRKPTRSPWRRRDQEKDLAAFKDSAESLIEQKGTSPYLRAELLRELGRFDESLAVLKMVRKTSKGYKAVPFVREKALAKDPGLFALRYDDDSLVLVPPKR